MTNYLSTAGEVSAEFTIERSRFIAYLAHTEGEEEAKAYLERVRGLHPLATHVCYGYIADKEGNIQRFSDDGEPQGTAGMPILGVLKAQTLREVTAAVVRYFGGIKLGAGGLTRAYSAGAAEAAKKADLRLYAVCRELKITLNYPEVSACLRFLETRNLATLSSDYAEKVALLVAVKEAEREKVCKELLNALNGRAEIEPGKTYYYPFPL